MVKAPALDFNGFANGHKGFWVNRVHNFSHLDKFVVVYNTIDNVHALVGIGPATLDIGNSPVELLHNGLGNGFGHIGHDKNLLHLAYTQLDPVQDLVGNKEANEGVHGPVEAKDKTGNCDDDPINPQKNLADIDPIELLGQGRHNVQASLAGSIAKHDSHAHPIEDGTKDAAQQDIVSNVDIGGQKVKKTHVKGKNKHGQGRVKDKIPVQDLEGQDHKGEVKEKDGKPQGDTENRI